MPTTPSAADGDGYGNPATSTQVCTPPLGYVTDHTDCDDSRASVLPGASEVCNDRDDNCTAQIDEGIDADNNGIEDCHADRCLGTRADRQYVPRVPLLILGPNRWELKAVNGSFVWVTTPQKKGDSSKPTIADTAGCSCKQILDGLRTARRGNGFDLLVQYLFGCSKNTLEDWAGKDL